jgi:hypothetical protein
MLNVEPQPIERFSAVKTNVEYRQPAGDKIESTKNFL